MVSESWSSFSVNMPYTNTEEQTTELLVMNIMTVRRMWSQKFMVNQAKPSKTCNGETAMDFEWKSAGAQFLLAKLFSRTAKTQIISMFMGF